MKLSLFLCALALSVVACAQTPSDTICSTVNSGFARVEVPPLPDKLDLAGEPVPMQNQDTRESLMREMLTTLYMHSRTMQTLLASNDILLLLSQSWQNMVSPMISNISVWQKVA